MISFSISKLNLFIDRSAVAIFTLKMNKVFYQYDFFTFLREVKKKVFISGLLRKNNFFELKIFFFRPCVQLHGWSLNIYPEK